MTMGDMVLICRLMLHKTMVSYTVNVQVQNKTHPTRDRRLPKLDLGSRRLALSAMMLLYRSLYISLKRTGSQPALGIRRNL